MAPARYLLRGSGGDEPPGDEGGDRQQAQGPGSLAGDLPEEVLVYAARAIAPHLVGREVTLDAHKLLGVRVFSSDLPKDFGLRSIFGRVPAPNH